MKTDKQMKDSYNLFRISLISIVLITLAVILTSCEKDDVECKCDLEVTIDGTGSYFVTGVKTDCEGNYDRPDNIPSDHFIIGLRNCK